MEAHTLKEYLRFVDQLADDAGKIMEEGFYGEKKVDYKNGNNWDLVTDYDVKVENFIVGAIKENFPCHLIIGEEGSAEKSNKTITLTEAPTWLIDPIDGTYNYAHGLPLTCISIALAVAGEVVLGLVYNPMSHSKYTALKGQGAFLNGKRINVSKQQGLQDSLVSFELSTIRIPVDQERRVQRFLAITQRTNGVRIIGSAALTLCMVASGGLDAFFHEYLQPWDIAAGSLILQEAGGYLCHTDGEELNILQRTILATANQNIAKDILEVFSKY